MKCKKFTPDVEGVEREYFENTGMSFETGFGGQRICTCGLVTNQHPGMTPIPQTTLGLGDHFLQLHRRKK